MKLIKKEKKINSYYLEFNINLCKFQEKPVYKLLCLKQNKRNTDNLIATVKYTKELYEFDSENFFESITIFGFSKNESFTLF